MKNLILLIFISVLLSLEARSGFIPENFKADFKKTVESGVRVKSSEGTLSYSYPGKIKFIMKQSSIISDGKKLWYYIPPRIEGEKGELTISSANRISASGMFDAINSNKSTDFKKQIINENLIYELSKKAVEKYGIKKITFVDKNKKFTSLNDCQQMIIITVNDKKETYELSSFDLKIKFKADDFTFSAPPKTNIKKG